MGLFQSKKLRIAAQIQAENDTFLFECFHDNGIIEKLIDNRFELIAGRKGTGKTAIARYLQREYESYGIDYSTRLTLTDLQTNAENSNIDGETLLKFLAVVTAQHFLRQNILSPEGKVFWQGYLKKHGLQDISSYKDFSIRNRSVKESKSANLGVKSIAGAGLGHESTVEYEQQSINDSPGSLMSRLSESLDKGKKVIIFIDDITDQFDNPGLLDVDASMKQIKYVLHQLNNYNTKFNDNLVDLTFVCTIRNDLWDYILGSNENKLIHNCLWLEWNEKSFCEMLIKRLPHFANSLEQSLADPLNSIKTVFPDNVFDEVLKSKGVNPAEIKQYGTKFYAYMQLISFNRPRDFLRLCHAMKSRLSEVKAVEVKHINASELEYSTYFYNEVRDELNIFTKLLRMQPNNILSLLSDLSKKSKLSYSEFRSILSTYIKASHSKTIWFIESLWDYSLVGIMSTSQKDFMHFKHNTGRNNGYELPEDAELKHYYFLLHRGIYWKYQQSSKDRYSQLK